MSRLEAHLSFLEDLLKEIPSVKIQELKDKHNINYVLTPLNIMCISQNILEDQLYKMVQLFGWSYESSEVNIENNEINISVSYFSWGSTNYDNIIVPFECLTMSNDELKNWYKEYIAEKKRIAEEQKKIREEKEAEERRIKNEEREKAEYERLKAKFEK